MNILSLSLILSLLIIIIILYYILLKPLTRLLILKYKHGNNIIIKYYPIIGIQKWYKRNEMQYGDPFYELKQEVKRNPKLKGIVWNFGLNICYSSIDPDINQSILIDNYDKSIKLAPIFNYSALKNGIIFSEGNQWKNQRKMIAHSFHFNSLKSRFNVICSVTKKYMKSLEKYCGQDYFPLFDEMMKHSGEIGIRVFFGEDFGDHIIDGKSISQELKEVVDQTFKYSYSSIFFQLKRAILGEEISMKWLNKTEKQILYRSNRIAEIALQQIQKKIDYYKNNPNIQSDYLIDVLVENYIKQTDPTMTIQQIGEQCTTMFIAALDNTGCMIGWTIFCLGNYIEEGNKVREEIERLFPTEERLNNIVFDDLKDLIYTSAFIDECFRMYSSSTGVFIRSVTQSFKAGGFSFNKNDYIQALWYGGLNNPDWFDNVDKFDVNRFLNGKTTINQNVFTPFSMGPRNCIGKHMSLIEMKIALIYFVKYYNIVRNINVSLQTMQSLVYQPKNQNLIKINKIKSN